jgi:hypothetical protein
MRLGETSPERELDAVAHERRRVAAAALLYR